MSALLAAVRELSRAWKLKPPINAIAEVEAVVAAFDAGGVGDETRSLVAVRQERRTIGITLLEIAGQFPSDTIGDRCVDLLHPLIDSLIPEDDPAWDSAGRAGKVQE